MLQATWQELLGQPEISTSADFFTMGGSSLLAMQMVAHIRTALGVPGLEIMHVRAWATVRTRVASI